MSTWDTKRGYFDATGSWNLETFKHCAAVSQLNFYTAQIKARHEIIEEILEDRFYSPLQIISTITCHDHNCCNWNLMDQS